MSVTQTIVEHPPGRGVYCNRTLNLRAIQVVGYDMDYTLVHYHTEDWERAAYDHLKQQLAHDGWPVADLEFDPELVVRGLIIDVERGNLLKVNRFGFVKAAYHGTVRMEFEALRQTYMRTVVELALPRYRFLNTLFALSEGCMYAQLVDLLEAGKLPEAVGYEELYRAVRDHIDATHTEGQLKQEIMDDPERFVLRDEDTVMALLDQLHAGKKLVLITNSEWFYTAAMMRYAFDPFLPGTMTWRDLFELTVVAARKPVFFESDAPLLEVVDDAGLLKPVVGSQLRAHGCYFGGSATAIERHLGVSGDEILYLGDHMYGDVHVTKNLLRWRTGLILRELEDELRVVEEARAEQQELSRLMAEKEKLEHSYAQLRLWSQRIRIGYGPQPSIDEDEITTQKQALKAQLSALDERIAPLAANAGKAHNARWGLLMRAGNDKSQLARQIERYADVYTSRVSNLLFTTPFAYLRSVRGSLPHDPWTL